MRSILVNVKYDSEFYVLFSLQTSKTNLIKTLKNTDQFYDLDDSISYTKPSNIVKGTVFSTYINLKESSDLYSLFILYNGLSLDYYKIGHHRVSSLKKFIDKKLSEIVSKI